MSDAEAGPSNLATRSDAFPSRRRSTAARISRPRTLRDRASSSLSARSDSSTVSSGGNHLSWASGDCFDYVDEDKSISAFLQCPICLGPFLDPYVSDGCAHTFCKRCITIALSPGRSDEDEDTGPSAMTKCPTCRSKVQLRDFKPTALLIKNMVDTLQVWCPNKSKGCSRICERHLLRGHVARECEFEYVDQDLNQGKRCGCFEKVMRKDWAHHGLTCTKRSVQCPTCDVDLAFDQLDEHCKTCSPEPTLCPHCDAETIKSRLPLHVAECEYFPVPCVHASYGCTWIGPRWQLLASQEVSASHLAQCRLEPLKTVIATFAQQYRELREDNAILRSKLDDLESRQRSQIRRTDDMMHSIGSWYRSAGDSATLLGQRIRGSQVGVDGEWDEFPLDAQNWEQPLSQTQFNSARRPMRSQSASAAFAPDQSEWMNRAGTERQQGRAILPGGSLQAHLQEGRLSTSYFGIMPPGEEGSNLAPGFGQVQASRSMPVPSQYSMPSSSGLRADADATEREVDQLQRRRSITLSADRVRPRESSLAMQASMSATQMTSQIEADGMDRTNLDSALTSLGTSVHSLALGLANLDKRSEDSHITAVKASFESARAQEEVQSLRHGLHAVRMQMHQMLMMQQQRYALFNASTPAASASTTIQSGIEPSQQYQPRPALRDPSLPLLTPPILMRRWGGFDQTKL